MRRYSRYLILTALFTLIALFSISMVSAPPLGPIGGTPQLYPFESQPTAVQAGSRAIGSSTNAYDGDVSTKTATIDFTAGYLGFESFKIPSDVGKTDFAIGYVDFKMRYDSLGSIDDEYRIVFYVGTAGPVVLKDWIGGSTTLCKMTIGADTLAETWGNQSEPEDGTWTWADIANITFRFETRAVGAPDLPPFLYTSQIYEVWLSVYPTAPPSASTTYSVMPTQVESLGLYEVAFIDLYVSNVEKLQVYEANLTYDSTALYAYEAWTYWPFTAKFYSDLSVPGVVSIGYYIDTGIPIVDVGYNGSYPIARIYFYAMSSGPSWLLYRMTKLIAPAGIYIDHMDWHGVYGTPPATSHLMGWESTSSFNWSNPVCTSWVEIFPEAGRKWHFSSVEEPFDPPLRPSYQIDMTMEDPPTGEVWWFHVDEMWETNDPEANAFMILTFKYKEEPEFPLGIGILMLLAPLIPIVYLWRTRKKAGEPT